MALAMNTPRAQALQVTISRAKVMELILTFYPLKNSIQKELAMKGYSTESDPVMAEYITIMLINNKTPEQITGELVDLVGSEYDQKFTDWLFNEAASSLEDPEQVAPETQVPAPSEPAPEDVPSTSAPRPK